MAPFRRPACMALVLLAFGAAGVRAQSTSVHFDIPRQRADIALTRFAQQAGIPVLFPYDTVSQRTANPLSGEYPVRDGLKILLEGTGLVAVTDTGRQIRIRMRDHSAATEQGTRPGLFRSVISKLNSLGRADHTNARAGNPSQFDPGGEVQQVVVTGSRIERAGAMSPTPVASLGAGELQAMAPTTLMAAVSQMPQFLNNQTPETTGVAWTGNAGASILNLRGVGTNRTLVLLDGRRVVSSTRRGTIDISLLPESLVKQVDVTTGGASAAYGSDAVSGVVNFLLDTSYSGLKGTLQGGLSDLGDNENSKASLTLGMDLGERAHLVSSVDYFRAAEISDPNDRDWFSSWGAIPNPDAHGPAEIIAPNVRSRQFTYGGLITSSSIAGQPSTYLAGTQFLPGGVTAPFVPGNYASNTAQSGGDGVDLAAIGALVPGVKRGSAFTHLTFDLSDDVQLFGQALYGNSHSNFNSPPAGAQYGSWPATIYGDNAFLPADLRAVMGPNDSFRLGRSGDLDYGANKNIEQNTDMFSFTTGIKGQTGGDWRYDAYYQYGRTKSDISMRDAIRLDRIYRAIDAVAAPDGTIVCRSTLTSPGDGCVPLNLFGVGSPSQEAIDYVTADRIDQLQVIQQHVIDATIQGEPWSTWAGPVSVATGAAFRREQFRQDVLPSDLHALDMPDLGENLGYKGLPTAYRGISNIFERGPSTSPRGSYHVWEVFAESVVPLAADRRLARLLDLNTAIRYANYQGSGGVMAWKLGLDWAPAHDLRLRATRSRDVRAGTLSERFDMTRGPGTVTDPFSGTNEPQVFSQIAGGNPQVDPEKADTLTIGFVWQPNWLPGFGITTDLYDIDIKDAIGQLTVQNIVDECYAGVQSLCSWITRDEDGGISQIRNMFINIARARTRGVDFEAFYGRNVEWFGGNEQFQLRAFATYVAESSSVSQAGAAKIDRAGQTGIMGGAPDWQANVSLMYSRNGFSVNLQERYISSGLYDAIYTDADINDNSVDAAYYTNLRFGYEAVLNDGTGLELYASVTNLFDADPPLAPNLIFTGTVHTNAALFDTIGRRYNMGVTVKF
jgi:outer membrane receptor protein involved in Fe transport